MQKKTIEVVTSIRGFLNTLFSCSFDNLEFINKQSSTEITGTNKVLLRKIFESRLFDFWGYIQIHRRTTEYDAMITYNRFLKTNKPYYIICENPTALFHYRLGRNKGLLARFQIPLRLSDDNLKAIVCISKACSQTFNKVYEFHCTKVHQIYPMIPDVDFVRIPNKAKQLSCLYVSSTFELKSGCEIVEAAKQLSRVKFVLVTRKKDVPSETLNDICKLDNIELVEYRLSKQELDEKYMQADVLLHPTRQDSYALVVLEAIKYGLPVLATNIYAIPEMIKNGINGYLTEPRYLFFDHDNIPNPLVWNHREDTLYSKYIDENIINFLVSKIDLLDNNRDLLLQLSNNSLKLAKEIFGEELIKKQWENLIHRTL